VQVKRVLAEPDRDIGRGQEGRNLGAERLRGADVGATEAGEPGFDAHDAEADLDDAPADRGVVPAVLGLPGEVDQMPVEGVALRRERGNTPGCERCSSGG